MKKGKMLADMLTKPLGGECFHTMAHAILGNHRFACLNRGAKEKMCCETIEFVMPALAGLSCSNHGEFTRKHKTNAPCVLGTKVEHQRFVMKKCYLVVQLSNRQYEV
jgi:hypothetical protein